MTVNLKDFKAMLTLCEALGAQLRLWFDSPGNPLVAEPLFPNAAGQASSGPGLSLAGVCPRCMAAHARRACHALTATPSLLL